MQQQKQPCSRGSDSIHSRRAWKSSITSQPEQAHAWVRTTISFSTGRSSKVLMNFWSHTGPRCCTLSCRHQYGHIYQVIPSPEVPDCTVLAFCAGLSVSSRKWQQALPLHKPTRAGQAQMPRRWGSAGFSVHRRCIGQPARLLTRCVNAVTSTPGSPRHPQPPRRPRRPCRSPPHLQGLGAPPAALRMHAWRVLQVYMVCMLATAYSNCYQSLSAPPAACLLMCFFCSEHMAETTFLRHACR